MELKQKVSKPTTHNRVFTETSDKANQLAEKWNCSKVEVYRWLVEMALEGKIIPIVAQGQLEIKRKESNETL